MEQEAIRLSAEDEELWEDFCEFHQDIWGLATLEGPAGPQDPYLEYLDQLQGRAQMVCPPRNRTETSSPWPPSLRSRRPTTWQPSTSTTMTSPTGPTRWPRL